MSWAAAYSPRSSRRSVVDDRFDFSARYDHHAQLEDEENRYERLRDGEVVETEFHDRSPAACWYTQDQALALFDRAGFKDLAVTASDTFDPARPEDTRFKVFGTRP